MSDMLKPLVSDNIMAFRKKQQLKNTKKIQYCICYIFSMFVSGAEKTLPTLREKKQKISEKRFKICISCACGTQMSCRIFGFIDCIKLVSDIEEI